MSIAKLAPLIPESRHRILAQARQEIFKTGFRFTMADISKQCGISTKTMDKLRALLVLLPQDFQFFDIKRLYELQRYYIKVWEVLNSCLEHQWDGVAELVTEGQAEGLLEKFNPEIFIHMYVGGLNRLMEQTSANQGGLTLREALNEMVSILLDGIRKR